MNFDILFLPNVIIFIFFDFISLVLGIGSALFEYPSVISIIVFWLFNRLLLSKIR